MNNGTVDDRKERQGMMDGKTARRNSRTYGNAWLYATLIRLLKAVGVKALYVFAAVCVVPATLLFSRGARIAFSYYRKRRKLGRRKAWAATYRNHCLFAETVIDKFAVYAGKQFKFEYEGLDMYNAMQRRREPFLQLGAHIGCSEILGYALERTKPYNVLVDGAEKPALMRYRREAFARTNIRMIPVGDGGGSAEKIADAFERGEIVGAFADRYMNPGKIVTSRLHGCEVRLAKGSFSLAVTRGIDVVMVSAMKERGGSYKAFFTPLPYDRTLPAKRQRQQLADAYTAEMERLLDSYPLQWFNYFDLWK